jgi:phytoene dehydrogenase-like protein
MDGLVEPQYGPRFSTRPNTKPLNVFCTFAFGATQAVTDSLVSAGRKLGAGYFLISEVSEIVVKNGAAKGIRSKTAPKSRPGAKLFYPEGRKAFIDALRDHLDPRIEFITRDCHIHDSAYSEKVTETALRLFKGGTL